MKHANENEDSDSQIFGGDDANDEFEQQLGQGLFNDDSHEEVVEEIALDPDEDIESKLEGENESLFDDDGNLKNGKELPAPTKTAKPIDF